MPDSVNSSTLANYHLLVDRVDELCRSISSDYRAEINCRAGCSGCCRHLTVFPVEAAALAAALQQLLPTLAHLLSARAALPVSGSCPLLADHLCLAYEARPIICRTHGLPILTVSDGDKRLDYCPENFCHTTSLAGSSIINIDNLNQALVAINAQFVTIKVDSVFHHKERFTIAEVIGLALAGYEEEDLS